MRGRCLSAVGAVLAIALFTLAASPCTAVLLSVAKLSTFNEAFVNASSERCV